MLLSLVFKTRVCHANMAASLQSFETTDSILSPTAVAHILERHVTQDSTRRQALFSPTFPLQDRLQTVGWYTWEASEHVILLAEGFREGHGHYRLFRFPMNELVGTDPWGFPAYSLAVYYAEPHVGEKWQIITAYPWTDCYYRNHATQQLQRKTLY